MIHPKNAELKIKKEENMSRTPSYSEVKYLVEADSYAQYRLCLDLIDSGIRPTYICGHILTIGELAGRPISIELNYQEINGKIFAFYTCSSTVCDYSMIEEWLRKNFQCWKPPQGQCNAQNFDHCLKALSIQKRKKIKA